MKKVLMVLVCAFLVFPGVALAKNPTREKTMTVLPKGEVVDHDYFTAGDIVEISGTVNGDVYAAGGTVLVDGVVNGDLMVAGGTITVSGQVSQDIRAAGGQITILDKVGRNATLVGGNIDIAESAVISGSLTTAAGNVNINSQVGDIEAAVGAIRLAPSAKVMGSVNYTSEDEISVSESASVSGTINRRITPEFIKSSGKAEFEAFAKGFGLFALITSALTSLVLGLLMIKFLPVYSKNAANIVTTRFLPSLGLGLAALFFIPILIILLFITMIGIPLGIALILVFILYLYIGRLYAMLAIGAKVAEVANLKLSPVAVFIVGLLVYYLLVAIPFVGGLVKLLVVIAGFGAALVNDRATWQASRKAKIV